MSNVVHDFHNFRAVSIYIGYIYWIEGSEGVQDTLNKVQKGIKEAQKDFEKGLDNMNNTNP